MSKYDVPMQFGVPVAVDSYVNRLLGRKPPPQASQRMRCDVCRLPSDSKLMVWRGMALCVECRDMAVDYERNRVR